jgi:AraC-like DNA-binding protein
MLTSSNAVRVGPGLALPKIEIYAFTLPAEQSIALPPGSITFLRSGSASFQTRDCDVLMDVNHALLFPKNAGSGALTATGDGAHVTLFAELPCDLGSAASVRLTDSRTYLQHYELTLQTDERERVRCLALIAANLRGCTAKPASTSARSPSYGRSMQAFANATMSEPFNLTTIAQACALSPFTASRVFHREAGISLRMYVRRLRLRTALTRIGEERDLSSIALAFGFFDHSHFTRTFRAEFGMVPSQWRSSKRRTKTLLPPLRHMPHGSQRSTPKARLPSAPLRMRRNCSTKMR